MQVYYVPFAVETLMPVTSEGIDSQQPCTLSKSAATSLNEIVSDLKQGTLQVEFDDNRVRLKVVDSSRGQSRTIALVDKPGVVSWSGGRVKLSAKERQKIEDIVERSCAATEHAR